MADRNTIIEAMARAMCWSACGHCEDTHICVSCRRDATAAYDTALPLIRNAVLEEAASVADTFRCGCCGMDGKAGEAIRALKDTP